MHPLYSYHPSHAADGSWLPCKKACYLVNLWLHTDMTYPLHVCNGTKDVVVRTSIWASKRTFHITIWLMVGWWRLTGQTMAICPSDIYVPASLIQVIWHLVISDSFGRPIASQMQRPSWSWSNYLCNSISELTIYLLLYHWQDFFLELTVYMCNIVSVL
jgi:hypothetical protein